MPARKPDLVNPFPGLRPFRSEEEYLFFGRESQVDTMVDRLAQTHFLSVIGTSGSGKSSLVNCGLVPALRRGLMAAAGTNWHVAKFRPGIAPISHLASALSGDDVLFGERGPAPALRRQLVESTLRMSKLGLVDIFRQARLPETSSLLVVVDQFEELFRYSRLTTMSDGIDGDAGEDATAFVNLLLEIRKQLPNSVYIALTMRSDFLGDCAQFEGLPAAIDEGQFLVPRMTRDERRAAIAGPVRVAGAEISPVLVTRLVNDVTDNPDQLSVLQHALNRTWAYWQNRCNAEGPIDLVHYEAVGTMAQALDAHAERAIAELQPDKQQEICERMFKALTDKATDPRGIRRPTRFRHLCKIARAPADELRKVIDVFRKPSRSFLMPPAGEALEPDSVIDISHESLMRGWKRLRSWADDEARSATQYRRLVETARLHEQGRSGLLRDPELQVALDWKGRASPGKAWARQYGGDLDLATRFLRLSEEQRQAERQETKAEERRKERRKQLAALAIFAIVAASGYAWNAQRESEAITVERVIAERTAQAAVALREAVGGDPVKGSLIALGELKGLGPEHRRAVPPLETALWQAYASTRLQRILRGHTAELRGVAFNNDGTLLATGSYDGRVLVYDTSTWKILHDVRTDEAEGTEVLGVQFTPDSRYLVTGTQNYIEGNRVGRVRFWDAGTGQLARELDGGTPDTPAHDGPVRTIAFSRTGPYLVTASYDNTSRVWNYRTGELIDTFDRHITAAGYPVDVYDAAFNPQDQTMVASVGNDGVVRVWKVGNHAKGHIELRGHKHRIRAVDFSPNGKLLLTASDDDTLRLWNWQEGTQYGYPIGAHTANIWEAIFDERGRRVFSASWDRTIAIWNAESFNELSRLRGHGGPVRALAYDPFSQRLASGSTDETARIWRIEADDIRQRIEAHGAAIMAVRMNPADPQEYASGGEDGTIQIRKLGDHSPSVILRDTGVSCFPLNWSPRCAVHEIVFSPDGLHIAARHADNSVRIWNIKDRKLVGKPMLPDSNNRFRSLASIGTTGTLAVGTAQGIIRFISFETGEPSAGPSLDLKEISSPLPTEVNIGNSEVGHLAYDGGKDRIAIGLSEGRVLLVGMNGSDPVVLKTEQDGPITSLKFSANGSRLFVGTWNRDVEVWSLAGAMPERQHRMTGHNGPVLDLDIVAGGDRLISVSDDETIRVWDTMSGQQIVSLPGHSGTVRGVAVVPGLDQMITVSEDETILIRDVFRDTRSLVDNVCSSLSLKGLDDGGYFREDERLSTFCDQGR